ncbi:predicted protein, partial [Postia placenta Mad-698-R]
MLTVAREGVCKPPDTDSATGGGEGTELEADGTGLGEGAGDRNVSKEIEDESQVEGLKDEGDDTDGEAERAEDAIEMNEDMGGQLQDVPDAESEQQEDDSEEQNDEDLDEQIGDLDAHDPSAVDEKLWGDETGPQDSQDGGKSNQDHSTTDGPSEMTEKDERSNKKDARPEQSDAAPQPDAEDADGDEEEEMEQDGNHGEDGAPLDDYVQEANTLDLPEDMNLDTLGDTQEPIPDEDIDMEDAEEPIGEPTLDRERDDTTSDAEDVDADESAALNDGAGMQQDEPLDETQDTNHTVAQPDFTRVRVMKAEHLRALPRLQADRVVWKSMWLIRQVKEAMMTLPNQANKDIQNQTQGEGSGEQSSGTTQSERRDASARPRTQESRANPLRSLGDTLREISQNLQDIMDNEGPRDQLAQAQSDAPSQMEYLHPEESDELQALGPAMNEKSVKLEELKFVDETAQSEEPMPMDEEDHESSDPQPLRRNPESTLQGERTSQRLNDDTESALTASEVRSQIPGTLGSQPTPVIPMPNSSQTLEELSSEVEIRLRDWQASGHPVEGAGDIWRLYESLTHDLSYALCEQLRLILEPTLATRLKGDYRTGKRLNMKKIIPYIASESRRTRFGYVALGQALSRLEVGDVAIAKFGESVDVLHGFDSGPFTDQAGMRI